MYKVKITFKNGTKVESEEYKYDVACDKASKAFDSFPEVKIVDVEEIK